METAQNWAVFINNFSCWFRSLSGYFRHAFKTSCTGCERAETVHEMLLWLQSRRVSARVFDLCCPQRIGRAGWGWMGVFKTFLEIFQIVANGVWRRCFFFSPPEWPHMQKANLFIFIICKASIFLPFNCHTVSIVVL